jgi:carboxyl-terminal processing protease
VSVEGIWLAEGYGWLMRLGNDGYERWQLAAGDAYLDERDTAAELAEGFESSPASPDTLRLRHSGEITDYLFRRLEAMPDACRADYRTRDPVRNFAVFCQIFEEHYPFFELRGVDWSEECARATARVSPETSPEELFELLTGLVSPLEDNHIDLVAHDPAFGDRAFKSHKIAALRRRIATTSHASASSVFVDRAGGPDCTTPGCTPVRKLANEPPLALDRM